ncbi:Cell wall protein [Actinidia chinensis var. chinensis]|uniref:Cell wall protein n=1 Tax=Actinidia chinensis var. chinensis TaxID=1590841 RepID=A0A2R6Q486_ACTCC|nr:Cell wall protein [Actinidia chinensis var. chinensis]
MEISLLSDSVSATAIHGLGFAKSTAGAFKIATAAAVFPVDAVLPPRVKSNNVTTLPRRVVRKTRRTRRRKSLTGGRPEDGGEEGWFFGDGSDGGSGNFGGGGGSGGGRGWNFDRFGGSNWDEFSSNSSSDPAFDVVYEVISWIALSNCLHFALKKVVRIVADGLGNREKVPMRFSPIC